MRSQQRKHWDTREENHIFQQQGGKEEQKHKQKNKALQAGERNPWKSRTRVHEKRTGTPIDMKQKVGKGATRKVRKQEKSAPKPNPAEEKEAQKKEDIEE